MVGEDSQRSRLSDRSVSSDYGSDDEEEQIRMLSFSKAAAAAMAAEEDRDDAASPPPTFHSTGAFGPSTPREVYGAAMTASVDRLGGGGGFGGGTSSLFLDTSAAPPPKVKSKNGCAASSASTSSELAVSPSTVDWSASVRGQAAHPANLSASLNASLGSHATMGGGPADSDASLLMANEGNNNDSAPFIPSLLSSSVGVVPPTTVISFPSHQRESSSTIDKADDELDSPTDGLESAAAAGPSLPSNRNTLTFDRPLFPQPPSGNVLTPNHAEN